MKIDQSKLKNRSYTREKRSRTLIVTNLINKSTNLRNEIHFSNSGDDKYDYFEGLKVAAITKHIYRKRECFGSGRASLGREFWEFWGWVRDSMIGADS